MKDDIKIVGCSFVLCIISVTSLYGGLPKMAYASVAIVDLYFIYVILYAGRKSDEYKKDDWVWGQIVPHKFAGVFVFIFLYLSAVLGLAEVFVDQKAPDYTSPNCALFKSWIAITSFSYDDYSGQSWKLQKFQMWQAFNGILLLTATFGFLISRISSFKENKSLNEVHELLKWVEPQKDQNGDIKNPLDIIKAQSEKIEALTQTKRELEKRITGLEDETAKTEIP